ncbi:MAG: BMP family protein [Candidatus Elarobacter sp.]
MFVRAALLLAVLIAAVIPAGCGRKSGAQQTVKVGMVPGAGGLGDKSFIDAAYSGLMACRSRLKAEVEVLQAASARDYAPRLTLLATKDADETVAIGYAMALDVAHVAKRFEKKHFSIIDAVVDLPNVTSVTFREEQGSFLAGALAARVSKTKSVAFLGGVDVPLVRKSEAGFIAGVREVDPRVKVTVRYAGSFDDVAAGKKLAGALFAGGADIVYAVAGRTGLGAIAAATARAHDYVIGADSDQDALAPGKVLTSVVKRVDTAARRVCEDATNQKPASGRLVLGVAEDGVGLTDFRYTRTLVGPANVAYLERLAGAIRTGTIRPPSTRDELRHFAPARVAAGVAPGQTPPAGDPSGRVTTITVERPPRS